jgi:hypothetical protein
MSKIQQVADAVVSELNGQTFSQSFTAEKKFLPVYELKDLEKLQVTAVPKAQSFMRLNRGQISTEVQVDIGIQKRIENDTEIENLLELAEEFAIFFNSRQMESFSKAVCSNVKNEPIYALEHLEEYRQFTGILTLSFKVMP